MQQPSSSNQPSGYGDLQIALAPIMRQLERMDERMERIDGRARDLTTRADLETLRKELVAKELLAPQLTSLTAQIMRVDEDRKADRKALQDRIEAIEKEQLSRQERLVMRLGVAGTVLAAILALFDFLSHLRFFP